jgi:hypothetical protein
MEASTEKIFASLAEPFKPSELEWRGEPRGVDVKSMKSGEKCKVLVFTYVQARAIQNRLDVVLGGQNWYDCYSAGPAGGVICSLTLRIGGEWITKQGLAENTQIEAVKGGESEALKRAAYKWGIGRYLYEMPEKWCEAVVKGRGVMLTERPSLPEWAYPYTWEGAKEAPDTVVPLMTLKEATAQTYRETPSALQKATDEARRDKEQREAAEQLLKALSYKVPTGHGLPSEGQTYQQVLETSRTVGVTLMKVLAGRAEGSAVNFTPNNPTEKSARSAAIYVLDHLPADGVA